MSELLTKAQEALIYWRLLIIRFVLHSVVTLGLAWTAATQNLDVSSLDGWRTFSLVASIIVLWGDKMIAFFDQTMSRVAKGQLPINGNTEHIKKEEIKP